MQEHVPVGILFTALLLILTSTFTACLFVVEGEGSLVFYRRNVISAIGSEMGRILIQQKILHPFALASSTYSL